jgi:AraC-like DNA-binding protein
VPLASPQLVRFWTEMLPERERFSAFREEFARQVLRMDVADLSGRKPHFDLTFVNLGQVAVGSLVGTASEFVRNTHHVKDGFGAFSVGVVAAGPVLARHAGQEHCLGVGSGLFFDHSRPHSTVRPNGGKVRNIFFPVALLKALVANPEDRVGQVVRPGPALGLLDGYMASLASLKAPPPTELGNVIGVHLLDLVAAALGPTAEGQEIIAGRGLKAARLRAVLAEIARRFGNPDLDVDAIASRLCLSRRSVQRLLEETGKPFTEHVAERRLQRAHVMLSDPAFSHLRIIDIALAAGFGDVSHFNRLFRRRFGDTPTGVRAAEGRDRHG